MPYPLHHIPILRTRLQRRHASKTAAKIEYAELSGLSDPRDSTKTVDKGGKKTISNGNGLQMTEEEWAQACKVEQDLKERARSSAEDEQNGRGKGKEGDYQGRFGEGL